jgi:hypothetical protein
MKRKGVEQTKRYDVERKVLPGRKQIGTLWKLSP